MKTKSILIVIGIALLTAGLIQHAVRSAPPRPTPPPKASWPSYGPAATPKSPAGFFLMYTSAAKKAKWFDEVVLIVWGPSAKLLSQDKDLQSAVKSMIAAGVNVQACAFASAPTCMAWSTHCGNWASKSKAWASRYRTISKPIGRS